MRPETGIESAEVSSRDRFTMILLGKWWRKTRKLYGQIVVSQEYVQGYYRGFRKDRMMISSFEISFWEQSGEYGGKDLKLGKYFRGLHVGTWQDCLLRTLSLRQVFFAVPILFSEGGLDDSIKLFTEYWFRCLKLAKYLNPTSREKRKNLNGKEGLLLVDIMPSIFLFSNNRSVA